MVTSPASAKDALSPSSAAMPKCTEIKEAAKSMLVMSGGEGYIDFRIGKPNPVPFKKLPTFCFFIGKPLIRVWSRKPLLISLVFAKKVVVPCSAW